MNAIWTGLWTFVNSPAAIAAFAAGLLWLLNRLYAARPLWQRYEGTVIAAIKAAEKAIPDDAPNTAIQRLDFALRYVLDVYESARSRPATAKEAAEFREGIQVVHADIEAAGTLAK